MEVTGLVLVAALLMGAEQKKEVEPYVWPPVAVTVLGFRGCSGCVMMQPIVKRMQKDELPIAYWDIYKEPHLPKAYRVRGAYPYTALLIDGHVTKSHVGFLNEARLKKLYSQGVAIRAARERQTAKHVD